MNGTEIRTGFLLAVEQVIHLFAGFAGWTIRSGIDQFDFIEKIPKFFRVVYSEN